MKPQTISCPSCGASYDIHNPGVIMVSCEYCGNAVYWDEEKVQDAGKQAHVPEGFSRLYRGAAGSLLHKRFVVLGRARYSFGHGFWDEWYLEMNDGSMAWLIEDNHELALETELPDIKIGPIESFQPGQVLEMADKQYHIQEVGQAECVGVEGALPKHLEVGEKYPYVDASSLDGRYTLSIEFDDDEEPAVYAGHWLKYSSLQLDEEEVEW